MSTTIIMYSVFLIMFVGALLPKRRQWVAMVGAILVAGLGIFADTPAFPWEAKVAAWLVVVALLVWRLLRDRKRRVDLT
ncbi:MAG TPA: hypothetical protein VF362_02520 [Demequinaceae bacterium]